MKWELKRKPLSKRKTETARNPWSQSGWWVWVYGGKDFWKRYVFSLEWKSEGVMDDYSGDSEEDEGEEDWFRQGWRSETGSLFHAEMRWCMSERTVCDFQWGAGWGASKSDNRGSTSTARRLERDKVMQVRGLRGSENLVCKREEIKNWTLWYMKRFICQHIGLRNLQALKSSRFGPLCIYLSITFKAFPQIYIYSFTLGNKLDKTLNISLLLIYICCSHPEIALALSGCWLILWVTRIGSPVTGFKCQTQWCY